MSSSEKIKIIYEDNHLLVAIKPPGILSQSDGSGKPDILSMLKEDLKIRYRKPGKVYLGLVHRLDMPVGGVMVFARTSKAAARISAQIRDRRMAKYYLAVVRGRPEPDIGTLQDYLRKNRQENIVSVSTASEGQAAWLRYIRLDYKQNLDRSLIGIKLGSGRSHQIRVQMAARGWPLIGDRRYGLTDNKSERTPGEIGLFAASLGIYHPTSHEFKNFSTMPPATEPWVDFQYPDIESLAQLFLD